VTFFFEDSIEFVVECCHIYLYNVIGMTLYKFYFLFMKIITIYAYNYIMLLYLCIYYTL